MAGALRLGLQRPDIQPDQIRLRQKISDSEGLVFKAGKQKEVDIVVTNGELLVFEVKSAPKPDDVDDFADKVELVRLQNPGKQVQGDHSKQHDRQRVVVRNRGKFAWHHRSIGLQRTMDTKHRLLVKVYIYD